MRPPKLPTSPGKSTARELPRVAVTRGAETAIKPSDSRGWAHMSEEPAEMIELLRHAVVGDQRAWDEVVARHHEHC